MNHFFLAVAIFIFACGLLGFLTRRNLILMFLSLELMLFAVSLNFIVFGNQHQHLGGQVFVLLILTIAACEAALALALIVTLYRTRGSLDINLWTSLNEAPTNKPTIATEETFEDEESSYGDLPKLTPAGLDPLTRPLPEHIDEHKPANLA